MGRRRRESKAINSCIIVWWSELSCKSATALAPSPHQEAPRSTTGMEGPLPTNIVAVNHRRQLLCGVPVDYYVDAILAAGDNAAARRKKVRWDLGTKATVLATLVEVHVDDADADEAVPSSTSSSSDNLLKRAPLTESLRCRLVHSDAFNAVFHRPFFDLVHTTCGSSSSAGPMLKVYRSKNDETDK